MFLLCTWRFKSWNMTSCWLGDWHSIIFQKFQNTWIFINSVVRTSCFICCTSWWRVFHDYWTLEFLCALLFLILWTKIGMISVFGLCQYGSIPIPAFFHLSPSVFFSPQNCILLFILYLCILACYLLWQIVCSSIYSSLILTM